MLAQVSNEYGTISIEEEVIARVAGNAAMDSYGVVGMGAKSLKDGIIHLLKRENLTKGVNVYIIDEKLTIDLHIIVEHGTNIPAIAEALIESVRYKVTEFIGLDVEHININVVGVRV
ncbi:MAG: Asp23/Gls24 family envelope stress response protein [Defluviitaleaceae bacterium]|nr:Asp23/Gls24 family envelope stress response protein [Defluviitaleaceae bacterium]